MCVLFVIVNSHQDYRLILTSNRDEFYMRKWRPAGMWEDGSGIFGGCDLQMGGTWFGFTQTGRVGAITNYRNPAEAHINGVQSRGLIVSDFLRSNLAPQDFFRGLSAKANAYKGFNLIAGDFNDLYYWSNRDGPCCLLSPGCYGLSNHLLDTPWPKVVKGKTTIQPIVSRHSRASESVMIDELFRLLKDDHVPNDEDLPDTGIGIDRERLLAPVFVKTKNYGTCASTVLLVRKDGSFFFEEHAFSEGGIQTGVTRVELPMKRLDQNQTKI